ncbi:hypothetical protein GGR51DRAFT_49773 [Nemania sp. FL0031]|nr:hypothetical protein GGR51DRAFT_49773 [Nemania sp. FL0031]
MNVSAPSLFYPHLSNTSQGSENARASPLVHSQQNTNPNDTSATPSATNNHSSEGSTATHHSGQLPFQGRLASDGNSTQADINGSSFPAEYSSAASNIYYLASPDSYTPTRHISNPYKSSYRDSRCHSTVPCNTDSYKQHYSSLPYSMCRWLGEHRYEGPYHAFVAVGDREQSLGVIRPDDGGLTDTALSL